MNGSQLYLVAVIGATFAYFTAQVQTTGSTTDLEVETTKLDNTTFTFNSSAKNYKYLDYPGGLAVIGADVEFVKDGSEDKYNYQATFDLKITYTNPTNTALNWSLYVLDGNDVETSLDPKCSLRHYDDGQQTYFWYDSDGTTVETSEASQAYTNGSCKLSTTATASLSETSLIAKGQLKAKQTGTTIDSSATVGAGSDISATGNAVGESSTNPFKGRKMNTNDDTTKKYYYLVIEYPNSSDQTADVGQSISVSFTSENVASSVKQ